MHDSFKTPRYAASIVTEIKPVDGCCLCEIREDDGDGFSTIGYIARAEDEDFSLNVSRFFFTPTQERFAFLVRNRGLSGPFGSWTNAAIDAALAIASAARRAA